jgi:hypothetical protein
VTSLFGAIAILILAPVLAIPFLVVEYLDKGISWLLATFHGRCK